jgi:glycosyl transferase family 87
MRRWYLPAAGALLFLVSCALARGGLFGAGGYGDVDLYGAYARRMADGQWPYRDFFDEYPVGAQPLFLLVHWLPGSFVGAFRWTMALCGAASVFAMLAWLRRTVVGGLVAGLAPLIVGPVFLNTYDLFPALLTVLAIAAWLHDRERTTWIVLALAIAVKVYAVVLLPFILFDSRRRRSALEWIVGILVLLHLPFVALGPGGVRFSYWQQVRRGLESESLGAGVLLVLHRLGLIGVTLRDEAPGSRDVIGTLPNVVAALSTLAMLAVIVVLWRRYRGERLATAAAAITAFVTFDKVLSPQYVSWLVPLVPAVSVDCALLLAIVLVLTRLEWERFVRPHGSTAHWGDVLSWWVLIRDLGLVTLLAATIRRTRPR